MRSVGMLLFDDVELLDFAGPYEVFAVEDDVVAIIERAVC